MSISEAIVRRASDDLRNELPEEHRYRDRPSSAHIQGDDVLLRQVFGNLVTERRRGVRACRCRPVDPHRRRNRCHQGCLPRRGADNGPGVPEAPREQIFQPFFTTRSQGTGLGLAIVQKIVVVHNGRVSVRNRHEGGATFEIVIPLAET